jgi:hypothetical protein
MWLVAYSTGHRGQAHWASLRSQFICARNNPGSVSVGPVGDSHEQASQPWSQDFHIKFETSRPLGCTRPGGGVDWGVVGEHGGNLELSDVRRLEDIPMA